MNLKELIKDNTVKFDSYRAGFFYYNVEEPSEHGHYGDTYQFPVPIEDIGNATLLRVDKAITFMRWIRKAINDGTITKLY